MGQQTTSLVFMVLIFAVFYFMLIRPQRKRDKEIKNMRSNLSVGDEVVTIGGIHGKIVKINDDVVVVELSHAKQRITFGKWAIGSVSKEAGEKKSKKVAEKTEDKKENKKENKKADTVVEEKKEDKKDDTVVEEKKEDKEEK